MSIEVNDAFAILVRASQDSNRTLRDIAEDLISSRRFLLVRVRGGRAKVDSRRCG